MRRLGRPYLQHGTRHLPQGSDPLPPAAFASPKVPVAEYTASAALPISSFATGSESLALDTFVSSTEADGTTYFDVSGGTAELAPGFYFAVGMVEFFTIGDWSGDTDFLNLKFVTNFNYEMGAQFFETNTTKILSLAVTDTLNLPVPDNVYLAVGTSGTGVSPLPENIVTVKASFARLNGNI